MDSTTPAGAIITTDGPAGVAPHHLAELRASGLTDQTITALGIKTLTSKTEAAIALDWHDYPKKSLPAICFPYNGNGYCRLKPDNPRVIKGRKVKYEAPRGARNHAYFPLDVAQHHDNPRQELFIIEGEKKAAAATQEGFPSIGIPGVSAYCEKGNERLLPELARINWQGREVYIAFDSDITTKPEVQSAESRLAKLLTDLGAKVRCIRLPDGPLGEDGQPTKMGVDDFLVVKGAEFKREFRRLANEAIEPLPIDANEGKESAGLLDPADEARDFLERGKQDGRYRLVFHRGGWSLWTNGRYTDTPPADVRGSLVCHLNQHFHHLTTNVTSNVLDQVKAQALLPFGYQAPCWLDRPDGCAGWEPTDLVVARNGILHLASDTMIPATPRLFTPAALDFDYDPKAPEAKAWLKFLTQDLWPDDAESVLTLQQWFGLCLVADTRHQKMLLVIGPKRSGKGTIARIMRRVVGEANCAGPTLASLGTNFGLQPLLGKTLAIFSDARLSGRTDQSVVTERLLSITGEDSLTIDRKFLEPVTAKLLTRLVMFTNEMPRLGDSSGALPGRMLALRLTKSFYGQEEIGLTDRLLAERAGILNWAIEGWRSLRDQGYFVQPESGEDLRDQMDELASPVTAFAKDRCIVDEDVRQHRTSCQSLYVAWQAWCNSKGMKATTDAHFGRDLSAAFPLVRRVRTRPESGERVWMYDGIGLIQADFPT